MAKSVRSILLAILGLSVSLTAAARPDLSLKSPKRVPGASYHQYMQRARIFKTVPSTQQGQIPKTAADSAVKFSSGNLPAATTWASQEVMLERFKSIRDLRFLYSDARPGFARRSTWLFPDDGCFARAQLANHNLLTMHAQVPKKVFVFGDLDVQTRNSPDGHVTWWYHVAPIVEVGGEKYVLDPALEPKHPLRLEEWLALQNTVPGDLDVAICNSGTYTPFDACEGRDVAPSESEAEVDQKAFFDSEWQRLESLGRNPQEELGEKPPWL